MPNIIELNLLNNKSIVATMQGHPLANENSYKIIAGEENATKFIIKSIPNQYANARLTVEMVNSQGLGIAERELSEIEVDLVSYKGFILPVGMAVAGYGYVSIKAYLDNSTTTIENGTVSVDYTKLAPYTAYTFIYNGSAWELNKNVVDLSSYGITISGTPKENDVIQVREKVVFQPLKLKVWNTLPNWEDGISNESSLKIENGHLYSNVNGVWIDIGNVGGEVDKVLSLESENAIQNKAVTIALSEKVNAEDYNNDIDDIRNDVKNLYAITAQGGLYTMLEVEQAFSSRETADGESIVDGQYTAPTKIQGDTVACDNLIPFPYKESTSTRNGITWTVTDDGTITANGTATGNSTFVLGTIPINYDMTLSGCPANGSISTYSLLGYGYTSAEWLGMDYGAGYTVKKDEADRYGDTKLIIRCVIWSGTTVSNLTFRPMLNKGATSLPYQPYFTGLKNAYFKGIKSTGKNLFDNRGIDKTHLNLSIKTLGNYISINGTKANGSNIRPVSTPNILLPAGTYTLSMKMIGGTITNPGSGTLFGINKSTYDYRTSPGVTKVGDIGTRTFTFTEDTLITSFDITPSYSTGGDVYDNAIFECQFERKGAATDFEPYKEDIYELPEAVELAFGDTLDVKNRKIINNGHTEVINIANKECKKAGTTWQREGFFSFYAIGALSKVGDIGETHRITTICTNGFSQGGWQFDHNTFENGTERYILTGNENNILYVIMPNSDLGVTQEDTDEVKIAAAKEWFANNSVTVRYKTVDTTETSIETPERYQAWKNGSETVVQGDTDNSEYGAMPTVTTEYFKLTEV